MADDPATEIMDATHRSRREHGRADLTRRGIATAMLELPAQAPYNPVEPAGDAEHLATAITDARTRRVAVDHSADQLPDAMDGYVERWLLADEQPEVAR